MSEQKIIDIEEYKLVEECINENREYQEIFYHKYAQSVFQICLKYSNNKDDAADFLQEGFIHVFRNLHKFKFEGSLEGWVKQVAKYRILDLIRSNIRYRELINSTAEDELFESAEDFELSGSNYTSEKIIDLVNKLPGKAGMILKLYVLEGLTHKEIAEHLDISVGTSKSQLNRARSLLKVELDSLNG